MAWTSPVAPAASSLITTSFWTAQITNNLLETGPAKFVSKGDLFVATGANAGARVSVTSASGGLLASNSACTTGVAWDSTVTIRSDTSSACLVIESPSSTGDSTIGLFQNGAERAFLRYQDVGDILRLDSDGDINLAANNGTRLWLPAGACGVYIGTLALNANMTLGLTIQQGANDDEILAMKSTSVAHGMTSLTDTDTYAVLKKESAQLGGLRLLGYSEGSIGIMLRGVVTSGCTQKNTSAEGPVKVVGVKKSGTTEAIMGADEALFTIHNGSATTRFIFDAEGDLLADAAITASAYDTHDDALLARAIELHIAAPDTLIRSKFDEWTKQYGPEFLRRAKLAYLNEDGSKFVCYTQLARLHTGAIWQGYQRDMKLAERLQRLEQAVVAAGLDLKSLDLPDTG